MVLSSGKWATERVLEPDILSSIRARLARCSSRMISVHWTWLLCTRHSRAYRIETWMGSASLAGQWCHYLWKPRISCMNTSLSVNPTIYSWTTACKTSLSIPLDQYDSMYEYTDACRDQIKHVCPARAEIFILLCPGMDIPVTMVYNPSLTNRVFPWNSTMAKPCSYRQIYNPKLLLSKGTCRNRASPITVTRLYANFLKDNK